MDTTERGLHAHTPETRTPENKRISTSNVSIITHKLKTQTHAILVYLPYILYHLLKCFFSPVDTLNAPRYAKTYTHIHTHTHTYTHTHTHTMDT